MKKTLLLLALYSLTIFAQDSLIFIIRVDDILSRNVTMLPRSITHFQTAVEQHGGKVTWAVIPHRLIETQNEDGVLARELKETVLNGHEIAMHGFNHTCLICGATGHEMYCAAQFKPVSYSQQTSLITDGLKLLKDSTGAIPRLFVPPGHAQDTTTFKVLLEKGFSYLSSTGGTKKFIYNNLYNLQQNNEYSWQLTQSNYSINLTNALKDIRTAGKANGYYCLLLHDPFIRQGYSNGITIDWINELMDSLNVEYAGRIKYKTLSEAADYFKNQLTDINDVNNIVDNFGLMQNYPNPFNPSTMIRYNLQEDGNINIKVFNILGVEICTLINEYRHAGNYEINFNGTGLTSGIYVVKMRCGSKTSFIKMTLIK